MKPPLISPSPRAVNLKPSTPASLQAAFTEGQWTNAANLAKQRHRVTKDLYYLAIEVAAKSQSDNVADRIAGKVLVESMIKDNVIITDAETIDLLEFSCSKADVKYSETIGLLRAKLVKAIPKDKNSCVGCFEACLYHSDWKNAQQIAASLNKNFNDRSFLYYYLLATHLYSISDDCPEGSRKVFSMLAKAQADKAFDPRTMTAGIDNRIDKAVLTESEALLWLVIRLTHCTQEENVALFKRPEYGALAFLEAGYQQCYSSIRCYLEDANAWDDVFQIGKSIFEDTIRLHQKEALVLESDETVISLQKAMKAGTETSINLVEAVANARPKRSETEKNFFIASTQWNLFWSLFTAAKNHPDRQQSLKQIQKLFTKMIKALDRAYAMKPISKRTYDLVTLQILFERGAQVPPGTDGHTPRVVHLINHMMKHSKEHRSYTDACRFVKDMSKPEVAVFLTSLRARGNECADPFQRFALISLALKLRYSVATSNSLLSCNCCGAALAEGEVPNCVACLKSIASNALNCYKSGMDDDELRRNIMPKEILDPLSELTVVGALSLLKLSGLGQGMPMRKSNSPLYGVDVQLFLLAVVWLDSSITASPTLNNTHPMLLVKLYLLMGCVFRAETLWEELKVKNAMLDSLGLLYVDRLSTIAPGLFMGPGQKPTDPVAAHLIKAFKNTNPKWIAGSLREGNYYSILEMLDRTQKQSTSCTLVMTVLEDRRGSRMKTGKVETPIEDNPFVRNLSVDFVLQDVTNYSILSDEDEYKLESRFDGTKLQPLHAMVNYGPLPTHTRAHLGLLAERFMDFVCYVQPKEYKPSKPGQVVQMDLQYAVSTCDHIKDATKNFLGVPNAKLSEDEKIKLDFLREKALASLTEPETHYHSIVWRLADMIVSILGTKANPASPNELRDRFRLQVEDLTEILSDQTSSFVAVPVKSKLRAFHGFGSLHAMGMLRESAFVVKHAANYLAAASEKLKNTDKTRSASELAWLGPELKKMTAAAAESEGTIKARIDQLRSFLSDVDGWQERLNHWTFGEYADIYSSHEEFKREFRESLKTVVKEPNRNAWADNVGESWRRLILKGWDNVKFD
ncbi:N-acetyltransferase B complex non catalytic subunit-domain-containing protein [Hypoxylon sp. FL1150]|nr:N-acetyltransferase B complex non catalytic subunit-domain-containing protein [Hypoxylon sp. FL1150]